MTSTISQEPRTHFIDVAVMGPLDKTFHYLWSEPVLPGSRVLVPFASRESTGVVLDSWPREWHSNKQSSIQYKHLVQIMDETPFFSATLIEMAKWLSEYYLYPLGEVFKAMAPASIKVVKKKVWMPTSMPQNCSKSKRKASRAKVDPQKRESTASFPPNTPPLPENDGDFELLHFVFEDSVWLGSKDLKTKIRQWLRSNPQGQNVAFMQSRLQNRGLIKEVNRKQFGLYSRVTEEREVKAPVVNISPQLTLTPNQRQAFEKLVDHVSEVSRGKKNKPTLLWGVTGSGKTELYLQLIATKLDQFVHDSQVNTNLVIPQILVMVPEISLTPQMTKVFVNRFPGLVEVVHSALSDVERSRALEKIRLGEKSILIGPRSAVFAPFQKLALIVVDEEHDNSYKQEGGLSYHGRDVAVLRGHMENCPVVLGSATPSLESYWNCQQGRYQLIRLTERAKTGGGLPLVEAIEEKPHRRGVLVASENLQHLSAVASEPSHLPLNSAIIQALEETVNKGQQAIILVNRRGYSYFLYDGVRQEALQCPNCHLSLTFHKFSGELRCHSCDYSKKLVTLERENPGRSFFAIGCGSQKLEDAIIHSIPQARVARFDSDTTVKKGSLQKILDSFARRDLDILVGTQMLAKGHDFPNVTLTVLLDLDRQLNLPDYRAGERTCQLIIQAAGRSGRGVSPGKVLIQCLKKDHPLIAAAIDHDYERFCKDELLFRQTYAHPPITRMTLLHFSSKDEKKLDRYCAHLTEILNSLAACAPHEFHGIRVQGPQPPTVDKLVQRYRRMILLVAHTSQRLRRFISFLRPKLPRLGSDLRLTIDVDPQTLL